MQGSRDRVSAVMARAAQVGLFDKESGRIGARVSTTLIEKARARTGLTSDTDLMKFALASVALEDDFAETFAEVRGSVDPALKLDF